MDNLAWIAIFKMIPEEKQNQFSLMTIGGTEIALQSFLRIESDFVALKGRLSGSQEAGRVFFIPYNQIDLFGTLHPIKETDYNDIFGALNIPKSLPASSVEQPVATPISNTPNGPPPARGSENGTSLTSRTPMRSEALERFRSRPSGPSSSPNLPNPRQTGG